MKMEPAAQRRGTSAAVILSFKRKVYKKSSGSNSTQEMYKNRTKILNIWILVKIFVYISKAELL